MIYELARYAFDTGHTRSSVLRFPPTGRKQSQRTTMEAGASVASQMVVWPVRVSRVGDLKHHRVADAQGLSIFAAIAVAVVYLHATLGTDFDRAADIDVDFRLILHQQRRHRVFAK